MNSEDTNDNDGMDNEGMSNEGMNNVESGDEAASRSGNSVLTNVLLGGVVILLAALVFAQFWPESTETVGELVGATTTTTEAGAVSEESTTTTTVPGEDTTTTTTTDPEIEETPVETTSTTVDSGSEASPVLTSELAIESVVKWAAALSEGDPESAWNLVAFDSRVAIGGRGNFDADFAGLVVDYGPWASVADLDTIVYPVDDDGPDYAFVVLFLGTILEDDEPTYRAWAVPTVLEDGLVKVSPFVDSELIRMLSPDEYLADPEFGGTVDVLVPDVEDAYTFVYVNGLQVGTSRIEQSDGEALLSGVPRNVLEVGDRHTLTVIYIEDGVIYTKVILFIIPEVG